MGILIYLIVIIGGFIALTVYTNKQNTPTDKEFEELKKAKLISQDSLSFKTLSRKEKKVVRALTVEFRVFLKFSQRFAFANPDKKIPIPVVNENE